MTVHVELEVPEHLLAALRQDPESYLGELRFAAAAKLYEIGTVSQEIAAEIAGLPRSQFVVALGRFQVSPFQEDLETLQEVLDDV